MCDRSFSKIKKLKIHAKIEHGYELQLTCSLCDKKFTHPKSLNKHSDKMHEFPCTNCRKSFVYGFELKAHIYDIHGEDVFRNKSGLMKHVVQHEENADFMDENDEDYFAKEKNVSEEDETSDDEDHNTIVSQLKRFFFHFSLLGGGRFSFALFFYF